MKYNSKLTSVLMSLLVFGMAPVYSPSNGYSPRISSIDLLNPQLSVQLSENNTIESINLALFDIANSLNKIESDCYQRFEVNGKGIVDICYILNQMLENPSKETFCLGEMELKNINTNEIGHQDVKTSLENIKIRLSDIKYYAQSITNFENVETVFPQLPIAKKIADELLFSRSLHTILLSATIFKSELYGALIEARKCQPNIDFIKKKIFSKYVYNYSSYLKTLSYEDFLNTRQSYGLDSLEKFISMCLYSYQEVCDLENFSIIQMSNDGYLMSKRIDLIKKALENILGNESLKPLIEEIKKRPSQSKILDNLKQLSS